MRGSCALVLAMAAGGLLHALALESDKSLDLQDDVVSAPAAGDAHPVLVSILKVAAIVVSFGLNASPMCVQQRGTARAWHCACVALCVCVFTCVCWPCGSHTRTFVCQSCVLGCVPHSHSCILWLWCLFSADVVACSPTMRAAAQRGSTGNNRFAPLACLMLSNLTGFVYGVVVGNWVRQHVLIVPWHVLTGLPHRRMC